MNAPAAVGLLLRIGSTVALRPELSFGWTTGRTNPIPSLPAGSTYTTEGNSKTLTVGVSAPLYVARWQQLRSYVVPRVAYSRTTGETSTIGLPTGTSSTSRNTTRGVAGGGGVGVEYALGDRFAVFGEVGATFTSSKSKTSVSESRFKGVGLSSTAGVIFLL
jgi:hypothetical protein